VTVDYTPALIKKLDARRGLFFGPDATLALMDYARTGHRGYDIIRDVLQGWHLSGGKEIDEPMVLEVAEGGGITAELLDKTTVFGINGKIYKMIDNGRQAPTYGATRVWRFRVLPTGEQVMH
jgi:hypothetical protein